MADTHRDWADKLPYALWAYWTSIQTSTGATPFSLVYGMEERHDELSLLDEKWMKDMDHLKKYQLRMARAFNKGVRLWNIKEGDLYYLKEHLMNLINRFEDPSYFEWKGPSSWPIDFLIQVGSRFFSISDASLGSSLPVPSSITSSFRLSVDVSSSDYFSEA
ncbi:uncharacterized protein LOC122665466 [Telopea speciosissima]|uniref:uncharacterized protein LOC122665466 n=1 Tax=Telopea speciosissima TaxID=54955 RepID=UPI001CC674FB|nr:uncharacterized protein LOC122665466 [Telopea speciosissima]